MKRMMNKFSILTIALIIGGLMTSACGTATKTNATDNPSASGGGQNSVADNNKANAENKTTKNKASNTSVMETQTDGLPSFKSGEDYKTGVREKMSKAGWKPARSKAADLCGSAEVVCDEYDEYESHTEKDQTSFRWQRGDKFVEILTVGKDSYAYDGYEFEKNSMTLAQNERWTTFWARFKMAIDRKDTQSLRKLMADYITGGGDDSTTASQWLDTFQEGNKWNAYQKTVAGGTKIEKCTVPCRVTNNGYLIFEYKTAEWKWTSLGGEGGGD